MKKLFLLFVAIYMIGTTNAQNSNVVLFTENGEKFTIILNGMRQNSTPETNVKLVSLNAPQYKMKVIFEDKTLGESSFNLFLEPGTERSISITKNKKFEYVLRLISEVPIDQAPPPPPTQTIYDYNTTGTPVPVVNPNSISINMNIGETGGGVNIQTPDGGMNMNMNVSGTNMNSTTTTTYSTTTTGGNAPPPPSAPAVQGYNGPYGCPYPMSQGDFIEMTGSIKSKSFEESKLTIAKQVLESNCLSSAQVRQVLGLFSFEETKLDYAKAAYFHVYDINNFYKLNDAFTFESSIDELNQFIKSNKH